MTDQIDVPISDASQSASVESRTLVSRRMLLAGAAGAAVGSVVSAMHPARLAGQAVVVQPPVVPTDPSTVPGLASGPLSTRSPFENPELAPVAITTGSSNTPHQKLTGTITPSDLVFQRHHNGIALIDPAKYTLLLHGMVDRPMSFTLDDIKRFPAVTRVHFIECAGNGRSAYRAPKPEMSPQDVDGMTSNCEWTGVLLSTLLKEAGAKSGASWILAEGGDAAKLARSIPMEKAMDDALLVYAQNGEALRAPNGYPVRLLLPGYEGNMNIKWLRRLELGSEPWMFRDETAKYTDPLPDGTARRFSFDMDAKSLITSPAFPERLTGAGWWPIRGIAWSGRGRIARVDVSTDNGRSWHRANIVGEAQPKAHTRFEMMWQWDGKPTRIMSRAVCEKGTSQPTLAEYTRVRGTGTDYHFNAIRSWDVRADGTVLFAVESAA